MFGVHRRTKTPKEEGEEEVKKSFNPQQTHRIIFYNLENKTTYQANYPRKNYEQIKLEFSTAVNEYILLYIFLATE